MNWDPITRIVGSLGIFTKIDFENKEVAECHSTSSIFRGYSIFMKGKDPRDAHFITSRICGICGDNHATCACYAQNMAFGVRPPDLGEWIVNLGEAAEYMFDHNIFQDNLVGVDFCEQMVKETNPGLWDKAQRREAPNADIHGYRTIADIMTALNPFTGEFYRETLAMSRLTREMFCLMEGRHVHPSTLYPGGVGTVATIQVFTDYMVRLMKYVEFMKKCVPLHDDLFDFWYEALPGYEEVGKRRILLGCWGSFKNPKKCDYTYKNMADWGREMYVTPGVVVDGELVTNEPGRHQPRHPHPARQLVLRRLGGHGRDLCPDGSAGQSGRQAASVEPDDHSPPAETRLRGQVHLGDVAPLVRQAHRRLSRSRYRRRSRSRDFGQRRLRGSLISATSGRPDIAWKSIFRRLPLIPAVSFEWKIPKWSNAIERDRARTYFQAYSAAAALYFCEKALEDMYQGHTKTWAPFEVPENAIACGFHEAVRGVLSHHVVIRDGKIANYHPYPPTCWNATPRDIYGTPGPYEDAVQNTPIFEENGPADFKGIDIMRTVRSFDPCLPCGVHMYLGNGKVLETRHSPMFGLMDQQKGK